MNWFSKYVTVWQSRIALGLLFFGAVVAGLWPDHARTIDPPKLILCITACLTWLAAEFASAPAEASEHDIALFKQITAVMNDDALTFLVHHDFHNYTHTASTEPVNQIAYWHGPNFMFNDRPIQRRWKRLFDKITALSHLYGDNLVTTDVEGRLTAWHTGFSRTDQPPQAHAEIKQLNDGAQGVYVEFGKFALYVRKRLGL